MILYSVEVARDLDYILASAQSARGLGGSTGSVQVISADPATNSSVTAAVPTIPSPWGQARLLIIVAGYTAAGTGALTISAGTPGAGLNYTVTAGTDLAQVLRPGEDVFTGAPTVQLAAGGGGKVGYLVVFFRYEPKQRGGLGA